MSREDEIGDLFADIEYERTSGTQPPAEIIAELVAIVRADFGDELAVAEQFRNPGTPSGTTAAASDDDDDDLFGDDPFDDDDDEPTSLREGLVRCLTLGRTRRTQQEMEEARERFEAELDAYRRELKRKHEEDLTRTDVEFARQVAEAFDDSTFALSVFDAILKPKLGDVLFDMFETALAGERITLEHLELLGLVLLVLSARIYIKAKLATFAPLLDDLTVPEHPIRADAAPAGPPSLSTIAWTEFHDSLEIEPGDRLNKVLLAINHIGRARLLDERSPGLAAVDEVVANFFELYEEQKDTTEDLDDELTRSFKMFAPAVVESLDEYLEEYSRALALGVALMAVTQPKGDPG